jgi:GTP-binding protein
VRRELEAYGQGLADKAEIVGLNKRDAIPDADIDELRQTLIAAGADRVLTLSGATGHGVKEMLRAIAEMVGEARAAEKPTEIEAWQP